MLFSDRVCDENGRDNVLLCGIYDVDVSKRASVALGDWARYVDGNVSEWGRPHDTARKIRTVPNRFLTHFVGCKRTLVIVLGPSLYLRSSLATK
jgi:hypothetical protein